MTRLFNALLLVLFPVVVLADLPPAQGRLLVATEQISGDVFMQTVILLLHYDETGAAGIVVNRPTEIPPSDLFLEDSPLAGYHGAVYWGGPVHMDRMQALLRTDTPPEGAERIVDTVYLAPLRDELSDVLSQSNGVRVFIGYAGWAPGQLDHELARGSWRVVVGSGEHVFAEDPAGLWRQLLPVNEYRASRAGRRWTLLGEQIMGENANSSHISR